MEQTAPQPEANSPGGAMEVVRVIEEAHEGAIVSLAYNKARREIYSAADGDKTIKASSLIEKASEHLRSHANIAHVGLGLENRPADQDAGGAQGHGDEPVLLSDSASAVLWLN